MDLVGRLAPLALMMCAVVLAQGRGGRGGNSASFPQRPPADAATLERGRTLYSVNCNFCHGSVAMTSAGRGWEAKLAVAILPALLTIAACIGLRFPPTERAAAGIPASEMFRELLNPLFAVFFFSMFLTAASELAPGQWVDLALSRTVHMPGILLLVYVRDAAFRRPAG